MSDADRERWDKLHAGRTDEGEPSAFLRLVFEQFPGLLQGGNALDLACGTGRNAIFLAKRGWPVDALDISPVALARVENAARSKRLAVTPQQVDLDHAELPQEAYDLIVNFDFLQRELFPRIERALRPGGYLIFETYLIDQQQIGHPKNPDYLLQHNELLDRFGNLRVLLYREGAFTDGDELSYRGGLFAQKPRSEPLRY